MTQPQNRRPLDLYLSLLDAVPGADEPARVRSLRRLLAGPREAWPAALRERMDAAGVSTGYLARGLLSIHRFAPEVRAALEAGLPFAVARQVNCLPSVAARRRALAPLTGLAERPAGRLLPRGVAAAVERRARAEAAAAREGGDEADARLDARGWLAPLARAVPPRAMRGDVWAFEPATGARAKDEPLAERVVEALLARTVPHGGDLVDVTAGRGTIGLVARRHGVRSWSGDLAPKAPVVHRADARTLLRDRPPGISSGCADLLVVHPPTFPTWAREAPDAAGGVAAYQEALEEMLAGPLGVVRPGGFVVMVTRPVRERGMVSVAAGEDWHLVIGRVGS